MAPAELTEYEKERAARIEANMERMKALNLQFMASQIAAPAAPRRVMSAPRPRGPRPEPLPRRASARQTGAPAPYVPDYSDEEDDDDDVPRVSSGRRAYIPQGATSWDGQREFADLPPLLHPETGQEVPRNKSCHICTQCLASWRGNFTMPLACSACPKIYCSRCLFHIRGADTVDESEAFIAANQGTGWLCFCCTSTCACIGARRRGLTPIEAHKRRGWVGVTGGGLAPSHRQPKLSLRSSRAAAAAEAEAEEEEDGCACGAGGAAGGEEETQAEAPPALAVAPPSPAERPERPTAPQAPTPVRDDPPAQEELPDKEDDDDDELPPGFVSSPLKPPPPAAPAKRARKPPAANRAAPAADAAAPPAASRKRKRASPAAAAATAGAPGAEGEAIVGRRVEAYWNAYKAYFPGVLESYSAETGEHVIRYDDGDWEAITLPDDTVRYEQATLC